MLTLLEFGPDKGSTDEWWRIIGVGAPESNQPTNQYHDIIFTNSDFCHCSVFIHTPVPELGVYYVQLDSHLQKL